MLIPLRQGMLSMHSTFFYLIYYIAVMKNMLNMMKEMNVKKMTTLVKKKVMVMMKVVIVESITSLLPISQHQLNAHRRPLLQLPLHPRHPRHPRHHRHRLQVTIKISKYRHT